MINRQRSFLRTYPVYPNWTVKLHCFSYLRGIYLDCNWSRALMLVEVG